MRRGRELPEDVRELLGRLARGERVERHAALPIATRRIGWRLALALAAAGAVLVQWAALYWDFFGGWKAYADDDDFLLSTPLAVIAGMVGAYALAKAVALLRSRLRPALIVTPALVVVTGHDDQPVRVDAHAEQHRYAIDGRSVRTAVGERSVVARAGDGAEARRFVETAESLGQSARTYPEDAAPHDWRARGGAGAGAWRGALGRAALALATGVFVVAPVSLAAWIGGLARAADERWAECERTDYCAEVESLAMSAENDFPEVVRDALRLDERRAAAIARVEEASWRSAAVSTSPSTLRDYLASPGATHRDEARARLVSLYEERAARYAVEAPAAGADPALARGMHAVLLALARAPEPSVALTITPDPGLETGSVEAVFAALTTSHVAPLAPAFTPERNREREREVVEAVRAAATRGLYGYLYVEAGAPADAPRIEIEYRVEPSGAIYVDRAEAALPESERTIFPGLRIVFSCAITSGPTAEHAARIVAEPAPDLLVTGSAGERPSATAVYDRMIATAFEQLRDQLVRAFGSTPPAPRWISWLPELAGATLDDPGGGDQYTGTIELGSVEYVASDYRARLEAAGFTVAPYPYAPPEEAYDWLARREGQAAHVRMLPDSYARGVIVTVSDVSGMPL